MKPLKIFLVLFLFLLTTGINAQQLPNTNDRLDNKQQSIVAISAFAAKGDLLQLQKALNDGLDAGLTVNEIKEVLVHLYAYAGFPRSLNAINVLQSVLNERTQKGIKDVPGKETSKIVSAGSKFQRGKDVQTKLTGSIATGAPQRFVPIIDTFLKEHLFADIFSRTILDWKTREIITISALASIGGAESQLRSHFNVGLNTGLTEAQLKAIVSVLQTKVGNKEGNSANEVLALVLNKSNSANTNKKNEAERKDQDDNMIFPKGIIVSNNNFTGTAWLQMLLNNDSAVNTSIGNVTFEPGARTKWHTHPGGQILLVTNGAGLYQEKGQPLKLIRQGDVIVCKPNVVHWHGASASSTLTHIAISTNTQLGVVVWLEAVTDNEYKGETGGSKE